MSVAQAEGGAPARAVRLPFAGSLIVAATFLVAGLVWAVSMGSEDVSLAEVVGAAFAYDPADAQEAIIRLIRLPRAVLAALVGANLAVAGVILQGLTRNALGAPEILGVNAGAAFAVGTATALSADIAGLGIVGLAFAGSTAAMTLVFAMAYLSRGGLNPVRIALAGVTVSILLLSIMQGVLLLDVETQERIYFWLVGGVNYGTWGDVETILPWLAGGTALAFVLAGRLNLLALGDDVARGLGQNVSLTRLYGAAAVVLLAGAAVSVAGPVTFVGLIVPHIVRRLVGVNHYKLLPMAALLGAALFVYADIASRYVDPPYEVPAGVVTGVVGAPVFIYLARREAKGKTG